MRFSIIRVAVAMFTVASLAGCASSPVDRFYGFNDTLSVDETLVVCIDDYVNEEKKSESANVHTFLNCVFRTTEERGAKHGAADVPIGNIGMRMLRAHAIVSALAIYGEYSMRTDAEQNRENAQVLLSSIEEAQLELWNTFKNVVGTPVHGSVLTQDVEFFDRIRLVYKVAEDAARPGVLRARNLIGRIANAIASQNPIAVFTSIKDARKGIARALTSRRYSVAYIRGVSAFLAEINNRAVNPGVVTAQDMKAIDVHYLKNACDGLAKIALVSVHHCVPADRI